MKCRSNIWRQQKFGAWTLNSMTDHSYVQLDLNSHRELFYDIPAYVGPRKVSSYGGIVNASRPKGSMIFRTNAQFASVALSPSPGMEAAFDSDRLQTFDASVGMLVINPPKSERTLRWSAAKKNAAIAFSATAYSNLAATELDGAEWELQPPKFGYVDARALRLAKALVSEVSDGVTNELYLDSLLAVFGVHLIREHSSAKARMSNVRYSRLSPQTTRKVIEYMHAHMAENVSIHDLAELARTSASHFIRAFTMSLKMPPHQYLVYIRLKEAERLLVDTELSISDIAFQTGFSSQSHLTTTMRRSKQITPGRIRSEMA